MTDFNEYSELGTTGYDTKQPIDPKNEFFHSIYIAGITRKNDEQIDEITGNLQIRGVEYNKQEINMVIVHVKQILAKIEREATGRETTKCFSYQQGPPPWFGTYKGHQCGMNSAERAADEWCKDCRAQLIVAGIYCDDAGNAILNEDKKPIFVFLRAKGMKFSPVADYLNDMSKKELDPFFTPPTEESLKFEKGVVNNKRFVTKVSIGEVGSNYGPKKVFNLSEGQIIPKENVLEILKIAKKTLDKFNDKFDWSKKESGTPQQAAQPQQQAESGLQEIPDIGNTQSKSTTSPPPETEQTSGKTFSFKDLEF